MKTWLKRGKVYLQGVENTLPHSCISPGDMCSGDPAPRSSSETTWEGQPHHLHVFLVQHLWKVKISVYNFETN